MAATKTKKTAEKKMTKAEEILQSLREHASKSGVALKRSTVENEGVYQIVDKPNGASASTKLALYCLTLKGTIKTPNDKVKPEHLIEMFNSPSFVPVTSLVSEMTGKENWKNFGKLKGCLAKEVRTGAIKAFQSNFDAEPEFKAMSSKIQKILK